MQTLALNAETCVECDHGHDRLPSPDRHRHQSQLRSRRGVRRAAYLRDGAPSLTKRRSDLKKFRAALLARRGAIEEAINTQSVDLSLR